MKPPLPLSALPAEPDEEWRYLPWTDEYAVSSLGRVARTVGVRRYPAGRLLTPTRGKYRNQLKINGEYFGVAQLVAAAFLPHPADPRMRVMHADGDKHNDRLDNLRWAWQGEIIEAAFDDGRKTRSAGEAHPRHRLTEGQVADIRARKGYGLAARLAAEYGVTPATIYGIWEGEAWRG